MSKNRTKWSVDTAHTGVNEIERIDTMKIDITKSEALDVIKSIDLILSQVPSVKLINSRLMSRFAMGLRREISLREENLNIS